MSDALDTTKRGLPLAATPLFGFPQRPGWYWTRMVAYPGAETLQWVAWSDHERCFMVSDGGKWEGDDKTGWAFKPTHHMLSKTHNLENMKRYMAENEKGVKLVLPIPYRPL